MNHPEIPADFPRSPIVGAVPGTQPKVLVRRIGAKFVSGWTDEELAMRYDICAGLVTQLIPYVRRKFEANPGWARAGLEHRLAAGIRAKPWGLNEPEISWIVRHACEGL